MPNCLEVYLHRLRLSSETVVLSIRLAFLGHLDTSTYQMGETHQMVVVVECTVHIHINMPAGVHAHFDCLEIYLLVV